MEKDIQELIKTHDVFIENLQSAIIQLREVYEDMELKVNRNEKIQDQIRDERENASGLPIESASNPGKRSLTDNELFMLSTGEDSDTRNVSSKRKKQKIFPDSSHSRTI
jgi:hypothetical protein